MLPARVKPAVYFPEPFQSLGASTATFGALGILTGSGIVTAWRTQKFLLSKALLVPLGGGLALLGWLGTGGENTDLFGHFFGFSIGLVLGTLAAVLQNHQRAEPPSSRLRSTRA